MKPEPASNKVIEFVQNVDPKLILTNTAKVCMDWILDFL